MTEEIKVYVGVHALFTPEGKVIPSSVIWENGTEYPIDKVLDICQAAAPKAGGNGLRYRIRIHGKETYLWLNGTRWFAERHLP